MEPAGGRDPLLEYALSPEGLHEALMKCRRGTLWKASVSAWYLHGWERCIRLSEEIADGTYHPSEPKHFVVTHPKRRDIVSIGIRDRIYQRSLVDNAVYPRMTRSLVKENCACQNGKGTGFARDLLERDLRRWWHGHGTSGVALLLDVKGYYPNMRHDVALARFRARLPDEAYRRVEEILTTQYAGDIGFAPGSQLVQLAGICILDPLDHMIKERLRVHSYIRYMDDMVLLGATSEEISAWRAQIAEWLASAGFELNQKKSRAIRISDPIPWLGQTFRLSETGAVERTIRPERVRQERRHLRNMVRLCLDGKLPRETCDMAARSWCGYARRECTHPGMAIGMERYYENLWKVEA